jgi:hypothetical protein
MNCFLKLHSILVAVLLLLGVGTPSRASLPLNTTTPVNFFTSVADNLLQSQLGLSVTNIPLYPTNRYTPAVHRLLQLAANICDASNTRTFPSVFRPIFTNAPGTNISIMGYVEEKNNTGGYLTPPLSLPEDAALVGPTTTNLYGVPWVIGVKRGLPNFNEVALTSVGQITRRLQVDKGYLGAPPSDWVIREQFQVGISNILGVEFWNSYTNNYPGQVEVIIADDLRMALTVTNAGDPIPAFVTNLPPFFVLGANYTFPANTWFGTVKPLLPLSLSFQTFQSNVVFVPNLVYQASPPGLTKSNAFQTLAASPPHFVLSITNRLRCILRDTASGRILDYVHLNGLDSVRDLTEEARANDPYGVWGTNSVSYNTLEIPAGIQAQLQIGQGIDPADAWDRAQLSATTGNVKSQLIAAFSRFFTNNPADTNITLFVPFSPTAKFYQAPSWQAADPLVHYTLGDLATTLGPSPPQMVDFTHLSGLNTNIVRNIGVVNTRYHPWNFVPSQAGDPGLQDPAIKDPLIGSSDDWNFPVGLRLQTVWLGRVHRGTPWQTVYLKSAPVDSSTWQTWTGNNNAPDALLTQPTNDWHLVSLLASLLNTNNPRALLSVNQINLATIGSTFSNGITVLTNVTASNLVTLLMDSNSPQAGVIVDGINTLRLQQPGQYFHDVGDILAAPELTLNSPWLNLNGGGLADLAYETIPSQIFSSLRVDSVGTLIQTNGQFQLQFTGLDGFAYEVQASTNLQDWSSIGTVYPSNGVFTVTDPASTSLGRRYYRSAIAP